MSYHQPVTTESVPSSWEVVFYESAEGARPAEAWLRAQRPKAQARFARIFDLLEAHGTSVREPYVAHLRGKIWEVRVEQVNVQHRLLYFAAPGRKFVILHGFAKQTQKTPAKEIEVAERRMQDYTARLGRK
jgi:phage-related protein